MFYIDSIDQIIFNKPIFYDGKFYDIKNTLVESIKSLEKLKVTYATVHLLNGLDALKAANIASQKINLKLLGVSVLTSFNDEDFKRIKKSNFEGLESMKKNSQYLAGTAMSNVLFGDSPFGRSMTEKSIKKIQGILF